MHECHYQYLKKLHYLCTAVVVHCRKRRSDHGILKPPSTSANTYWQFEKECDPLSGEYGRWGGERRRERGGRLEEKGEWKRGMKMILSLSLGEPLSWGERCHIKPSAHLEVPRCCTIWRGVQGILCLICVWGFSEISHNIFCKLVVRLCETLTNVELCTHSSQSWCWRIAAPPPLSPPPCPSPSQASVTSTLSSPLPSYTGQSCLHISFTGLPLHKEKR